MQLNFNSTKNRFTWNPAKEITDENNIKVDIISKDLSKSGSPKEIFEFCKSNNYKVEILVNNAGYGIKTSFHETSIEAEEDFIRVLGTSVIMLTKLFLPEMLDNGGGKIMIVSSVASFAAPSAIQPLYGPIKTFMNRFSDAININYKHKGITLHQFVRDLQLLGFMQQAEFRKKWIEFQNLWFFQQNHEEAVQATLAGKALCVPTKTYKLLVFMLKNIPQSILRLLGTILAPGRYDRN